MNLDALKRPIAWVWVLSLTLLVAMAAMACGGGPTATPITELTPALVPTSIPQPGGTQVPTSQAPGVEPP